MHHGCPNSSVLQRTQNSAIPLYHSVILPSAPLSAHLLSSIGFLFLQKYTLYGLWISTTQGTHSTLLLEALALGTHILNPLPASNETKNVYLAGLFGWTAKFLFLNIRRKLSVAKEPIYSARSKKEKHLQTWAQIKSVFGTQWKRRKTFKKLKRQKCSGSNDSFGVRVSSNLKSTFHQLLKVRQLDADQWGMKQQRFLGCQQQLVYVNLKIVRHLIHSSWSMAALFTLVI